VILCVPTARVLVLAVARPPLKDGVPITVFPSATIDTTPVGELPSVADTWACIATELVTTAGFGDAVKTTPVGIVVIVCPIAALVLARYGTTPAYAAVIECEPIESVRVVRDAVPPASEPDPNELPSE